MNDRGYIKRIYRVPKDRGALECLQTLIIKKLVQHGWPAVAGERIEPSEFEILHHSLGRDAGPDFWQAVSIACRIVAQTYRVDLTEGGGWVLLNRNYTVTKDAVFREFSGDVLS